MKPTGVVSVASDDWFFALHILLRPQPKPESVDVAEMHVNLRLLLPFDDAAGILASTVRLIAKVIAKHTRPRWLGPRIHFRIRAARLSPGSVQVLSELPDGVKLTLSGVRLNARSLKLLADQCHDSLPKEDYAHAHDFLRRMIAESRLPAQKVVSGTQLVSRS